MDHNRKRHIVFEEGQLLLSVIAEEFYIICCLNIYQFIVLDKS
ncbi:hypothetical protein MtrunA17_Chr1g0167371 [Medicago truncatula]|uniref:Transmembrane protein n=1 Tax=Medicago truncatula TaxID=3880 RepID=A0A396JK07_MEDTR|nr:hypothetical protein MtrunA17_Chr1g0167371 [Medicago truncatula]